MPLLRVWIDLSVGGLLCDFVVVVCEEAEHLVQGIVVQVIPSCSTILTNKYIRACVTEKNTFK